MERKIGGTRYVLARHVHSTQPSACKGRQLHLGGCINHGAGRITIADRARLEAAARECHGVIQGVNARL